ncbi:unnamed protein product, partial [Musa hybrid cultivar]
GGQRSWQSADKSIRFGGEDLELSQVVKHIRNVPGKSVAGDNQTGQVREVAYTRWQLSR